MVRSPYCISHRTMQAVGNVPQIDTQTLCASSTAKPMEACEAVPCCSHLTEITSYCFAEQLVTTDNTIKLSIKKGSAPSQKCVQDRRPKRWQTLPRPPALMPASCGGLEALSPQQGDLRLSGPPSGQGAGGGARASDRGVPADLRADSLATVPPMPPVSYASSL
ncbi:hypothetical protein PoB_004759500 [Plakobranchus ocellatus]|uniref:Uncharacterized protein n=1 Tax=Plakobranchus ocellatus TaxID=259542 RepID=A0AAV4BPQ4_9GAST|nr:hypothetical protein PoB_004759500 [Plakobranchus ocellatus]